MHGEATNQPKSIGLDTIVNLPSVICYDFTVHYCAEHLWISFQAGEHHILFQNLLIYPDDLVGKLFSLVQQQVVELKPFLLVSFYKENYVFGLVGIHSHFLSQNLTDCSNSEAQLQSLLICLTEILRVTGRHGLDCLLDLLRFFCFSFSLLVVSSIGTNWIFSYFNCIKLLHTFSPFILIIGLTFNIIGIIVCVYLW